MTIEDLVKVLKVKAGFEVVNKMATDNRIQLYGRVPGSAERMLAALFVLLQLDAQSEISCDLSRQYILKNGKMVYRWRLIFQTPEIATRIKDIVRVVNGAPTPQASLEEFPLPGVTGDRGALKNGKGAQHLGGARVGPAAMRNR